MEMKCSNCGSNMTKDEYLYVLSRADANFSTGHLVPSHGEGLPVHIYACKSCGKLELKHAIPSFIKD